MNQIFLSKRGLAPASIGAAIFCLLLIVGCVISPRRIVGGGTGGTPTPTPTATPTPNPAAAGKLYVMNSTTNSLLRFDNAFTANGNATPAATIVGSNTTFSSPNYMTLDAANDRLYIANTGDLSILIYDNISTKTGNVAPNRIIAGAVNTTLIGPVDVSLDRVRNLLYVADDQQVVVFASASTANGDIAPARILTTTFALGVAAVFIDANNDRLYAADPSGNAIAVYDNASTLPTSTITPNRTIQGTSTQLSTPSGIQIDSVGRLVVSNATPCTSPSPCATTTPVSITIYSNAAGANGNIAPVAEISGSNTGMSVPNQIAVDPSGTGTVYSADPGAARVAVFANLNTANGNIAPNRSISGASTGLTATGSVGVAIDNTR
jgi:hypothetical protein